MSIQNIARDLRVHYTTDGTEPKVNSQPYVKPFSVGDTTTVKAIAVKSKNEKSFTVTATFRKLPHNWTIKLLSKYSSQYSGGGDSGLIDGIRGSANLSDGAWQGYQGQDFVAVVDLGKIQTVSQLGAGFLQDLRSWIWMPRRIQFELSTDGQNFAPVLSISNDVPDNNYDVVVKDFGKAIAPRPARYVRVKAYNYGLIPAWHPGRGGQAWMFIDEIIIL